MDEDDLQDLSKKSKKSLRQHSGSKNPFIVLVRPMTNNHMEIRNHMASRLHRARILGHFEEIPLLIVPGRSGVKATILAEKLHICHSISMPQFRKTHGIPVYLSNGAGQAPNSQIINQRSVALAKSFPTRYTTQAKSSKMLKGTLPPQDCVPLTTLGYPHVSRRHRQHMHRAKT